MNRRGEQQGVMMIEVLIGILIFSIGILAMLGMQTMAMRATVDAKYRA
jgi:type IV pilus assembly protein PilV